MKKNTSISLNAAVQFLKEKENKLESLRRAMMDEQKSGRFVYFEPERHISSLKPARKKK